MKINDVLQLNNLDKVKIIDKIPYYGKENDEIDYLIKDSKGRKYVIAHDELIKLVRKQRTSAEKIALYGEYFSGRPDVYAQKWSNSKGYSPALKNWWDFYQARNNKYLQSKLIKEYAPYTSKTIYDQILKDDPYHRYGIYPLLSDNCTNLLVFDIDQHNVSAPDPKKISKRLILACQKYNIDCLPEISCSGHGYHIWIFFKHIPAKAARKLGILLLIEAMSSMNNFDISSFDRMIPNQDNLINKSFGNLIALPLKWADVRKDRSIFTDDNLIPTDPELLFDQLAKTKRYSEGEVDQLVTRITKDQGLIMDNNLFDTLKKAQIFPSQILGYIAGNIYIEKKNLTRSQQLTLLGLATIENPEYIKRKHMRMPVWNVPSMVTSASVDREYICLPRGCLLTLSSKCQCNLKEKYTSASKIEVKFLGCLHNDQKIAVDKVYAHQLAMICGHTGFGKTVVGLAMIAKRKVRTVVIVPTTNLAKQWQKQGLKFLRIKTSPFEEITPTGRKVKKQNIEIITGNRNHPSHLVDIITIQKLVKMSVEKREAFFKHYGQVIVDECHHIAAATFEQVLASANCKYLIGLTATPQRKDGLEEIMHLRLGQIVYKDEGREQENVLIHRYLYPRYCGIKEISNRSRKTYAEKINDLVEDHDRNSLIIEDIQRCLNDGRHILLLSERVKHLKLLKNMLESADIKYPIHLITGSLKTSKNIDLQSPGVILSTTKYVGEGLDIPILDTLFVTLPFSWKGNTQQYLGRLERGLSKKDELRIFDYVDISDDMFVKMYQKRLRVYRQAEYEIVINNQNSSYESQYYDYHNYLPVWINDLQGARTIYLKKKTISQDLLAKLEKLSKCCKITVELLNDVDRFSKSESDNICIKKVNYVGNNICILDQRICWYGDLDFGGIVQPYMTAVRINSRNLAKDARS